MKKSLIKVAALSVSATMLLGVAGCSKKESEETKKNRAKDSDAIETEEIEETKKPEEVVVETSVSSDPVDPAETSYEFIEPEHQSANEFDEAQMDIIVANRSMWDYGMKGEQGTAKYAVTDLDDDGNYEIIASLAGGSLLNTDSNMYEVDPENDALVLIGAWNWNGETEDDVELDWTDSYYSWVIMDGNFVYAVHNYINLGSDGTIDKVYHVTFTDDGLTDELVAIKNAPKGGSPEDGEYSDGMGNEEDWEFYETACLRCNLQLYDDCDGALIEWIPMDSSYSYADSDVYDKLVYSWGCFNLRSNVG